MEKQLINTNWRNRQKQLRRDIVTMLAEAGSGHPGGSLFSYGNCDLSLL